MAIIKCKMCGGDLALIEGQSVAECEYCGSRQTVPVADNEKKLTLFARANRLRAACEFDKAAGIYESIVADFPEEAEAYWGLVLCKYGIEYVDDPATGKKIPTCHRSSFDSIMDDGDFEQVLENADSTARRVYREEAKQIEEIRKGIIAVSANEEPYDIFICYKETDENGDRTLDSVLAQDVYDALTDKGYRVFFSRITLEDKLGVEYEPYIFAALNSSKIMLAIGTDYEYFNAVWVKNEWSRYLKLMAKDKTKHLIPCFKGIDAYDMPKEFARLQAQDLGKVGAIQDLLRGVEKLIPRQANNTTVAQETISLPANHTTPLLDRAFLFLEDAQWEKAEDYCEKVLDMDPRSAMAYVGKLMVERKVTGMHALKDCAEPLTQSSPYTKAIRFADARLKLTLEAAEAAIQERLEAARRAEEESRKAALESRKTRLEFLRNKYAAAARLVATGDSYTAVLKIDSSVAALGDHEYGQCEVSEWTDIVAISAGWAHTVGLKTGGAVVAVGDNKNGQCEVSDWTDIVAISAGCCHTVGLKADGAVVAVGDIGYGQCDVSNWKDIVAISAGADHVVGLNADGTVVAVGDNEDSQCEVSDWKDIVAISAGCCHTVGLKADGTVVAVGDNEDGQCEVSGWTNIIAISAGGQYTVGLKANGAVVAVGDVGYGQCNVHDWKDIVAISTGWAHTVGLRVDGTLVAVGENIDGQCKVSGWKLFHNLETIEEEREAARISGIEQAEAERKCQEKMQQYRAARLCQHCGGTFKGLFAPKCTACGLPKDY